MKRYSPEWKAKIAESLRRAWKEGRMNGGGFQPGNKCGGLVKDRAPIVRAALAVTKGSNGFGRTREGNPEHVFARQWVLESPDGERFEFSNLREWCRQNEDRFYTEPGISKKPLWVIASNGIRNAIPGNKHGRYSWRGWVVVSVEPPKNPLPAPPTAIG